MKNWFIKTLGLKGSWKWACKQMANGKVVRPDSASGSVKYKLDDENQGRLCWTFKDNPTERNHWESANFFMRDASRTDWVLWEAV